MNTTTTLTQAIKNNPYLKASNLCDVSDCDSALVDLKQLFAQYGNGNRKLCAILSNILNKREKFTK